MQEISYTIFTNLSNHLIWVMVFNATFNNISVISWRSVLLVEETGVHGENHRPATSHCKSNYHTITTMTAPQLTLNQYIYLFYRDQVKRVKLKTWKFFLITKGKQHFFAFIILFCIHHSIRNNYHGQRFSTEI